MNAWWKQAQRYELDWHKRIIAGEPVRFDAPNILHEFFADDTAAFNDFQAGLVGKSVLEIGCGAWPVVLDWPSARTLLVEPLGALYEPGMMPPLPKHVELLAESGELALPPLAGKIDGALVCRNCVDHSAEPVKLLNLLLDCAAPDCTLLFWGDYLYLQAPDEGHQSWAGSAAEVRALIEPRFEIVREAHCRDVPVPHTQDWGCVAKRRGA